MALCLAESLLACKGFDAKDQMERYVSWWREGHLSSTGECFDIGLTVAAALSSYMASGEPFSGSEAPDTAGNGAIMRLAPVVLYFFPSVTDIQHFVVESTRTTHAAPEALDCSRLLGHILTNALAGSSKDAVLNADVLHLTSAKVSAIASGGYRSKPSTAISGSGYAVASLEAALWCFHTTTSFESAVLQAVNLGDDADTTAAIVGQIAGAHYGALAIPVSWRERLHMSRQIERAAHELGRANCAAQLEC